jgi:hypothetical protein
MPSIKPKRKYVRKLKPLELIYERPPKNYNPVIVIDDITFYESDKIIR